MFNRVKVSVAAMLNTIAIQSIPVELAMKIVSKSGSIITIKNNNPKVIITDSCNNRSDLYQKNLPNILNSNKKKMAPPRIWASMILENVFTPGSMH